MWTVEGYQIIKSIHQMTNGLHYPRWTKLPLYFYPRLALLQFDRPSGILVFAQ